jgi:hypothetical protein
VDDDKIASIVVQKIPGFTVPLAVFIFENTPTSQLYYTASFFYILIMESIYTELGPNRTKVETTYCIGAPKFLKWSFPLLRWLIKRNYRDLMSSDIPMRERRGQLRSWGYQFYKDSLTYSYLKSADIRGTHVISPSVPEHAPIQIFLEDNFPMDGEYFWGRDDAWGLRIVRFKNKLSLFGRMCHHEGASLDKQVCVNDQLKCPWHGKLFSPIATFQMNSNEAQAVSTKFHSIHYVNGCLNIVLQNSDIISEAKICTNEESYVCL